MTTTRPPNWRIWRSAESGRWIAVSDSLLLALEADSIEELDELIVDAVALRERSVGQEAVP